MICSAGVNKVIVEKQPRILFTRDHRFQQDEKYSKITTVEVLRRSSDKLSIMGETGHGMA